MLLRLQEGNYLRSFHGVRARERPPSWGPNTVCVQIAKGPPGLRPPTNFTLVVLGSRSSPWPKFTVDVLGRSRAFQRTSMHLKTTPGRGRCRRCVFCARLKFWLWLRSIQVLPVFFSKFASQAVAHLFPHPRISHPPPLAADPEVSCRLRAAIAPSALPDFTLPSPLSWAHPPRRPALMAPLPLTTPPAPCAQ